MSDPKHVHSSLRFGGVSAVLEHVRDEVVTQVKTRLEERRRQGWADISDEEIESIARMTGMVARKVAADGVAEAFQMGVNRSTTGEEHSRPTQRVTPTPPSEPER